MGPRCNRAFHFCQTPPFNACNVLKELAILQIHTIPHSVAMLSTTLDLVVVSIFFVWVAMVWVRKRQRRLPPGPLGYPFIGNLLDVPREKPWLRYVEWGALYRKYIAYYTRAP